MANSTFTSSHTKSLFKSLLILAALFSIHFSSTAQTAYSYSISDILNSGTTGVTLPDGTIVTAKKIVTGTGSYGTTAGSAHGEPGPSIGGTFTGVHLSQYTGSTDPLKFTKAVISPSTTCDNGVNTNYADAIGFHLHFSQPIANPQFLIVDIDGSVTSSGSNGNSEWTAAYGYNGTSFVSMNGTYSTASTPAQEITTSNATLATNHAWNTMTKAEIPGASDLPGTYTVYRQNSTNDGPATPDEIQNQVLVSTTSSITDFFVLIGIYKTVGSSSTQQSGFSPITVVVYPNFGDAPDSYGSLLSNNGASHGVIPNLKFGALCATDADGQPNTSANSCTDDDGVSNLFPIMNSKSSSQVIASYTLTTSYTNNLAVAANAIAWIDWNNNGTFEAGEAKSASVNAGTTGNISFTWNNVSMTTSTQGDAGTYARIRITSANMTAANPTGAFKDGEVEDYYIPFNLSVTLPLKLVSFDATVNKNSIDLKWQVEAQVNVKDFTLEKSSDGLNYTAVNKQPLFASVNNYQYTDAKLNAPVLFYRLLITDFDGKTEYSKSIKVITGSAANITITPNPVKNFVNIQSNGEESLQLKMISVNGTVMLKENINDARNHTIDTHLLVPGMYVLQLTNKQEKIILSKKIIKY